MIALAALLAAGGAVSSASPLDPIDAFRKVCMEGRAEFRKGTVAEVPRAAVPWKLLPQSRYEQYFLSTNRKTVIAVAKPDEDGQQCTVVTELADKRRIYELGFAKNPGDELPPLHDQKDVRRTVMSSYGYWLVADRWGPRSIQLTTYIMTPKEVAEESAKLAAAKRPVRAMSDGNYKTTTTIETKREPD